MFFIMKRLAYVLLMLTLMCNVIYSQTAKEIEKQHKELIKKLKKENNLKSVEVKIEKDGYWYFLLTGKNKMLGVANNEGKVIIPVEKSIISYFSGEKKGIVKTPITDKYIIKAGSAYPYEETSPVFLTLSSYYTIFSLNGEVLRDGIIQIRKIPGYWIISTYNDKITYINDRDFIYRGKCIGLLNGNGELLIEPKYECIIIGGLYEPKDESKLNELVKIQMCTFSKKNENGIKVEGAITLNGMLKPLPCIFNGITIDHKYEIGKGIKYIWLVKKTELGRFEEYTEDSLNGKYRDKGEELFEQKKYDEVVEYYSKEGINQPWSKFYSGVSLFNLGLKNSIGASMLSEYIENNQFSMYEFSIEQGSTFDLELSKKQYLAAINLLKAYLKEDETFKEQAETHISICNSHIEDLPKLNKRYNDAILKLEKIKQDEIKRQREAALQAQQQRTEFMLGILNIFANSLLKASSPSSSSGSGNVGGGYVVPSSTSSSKGTTSNNSSKIAYWENRRSDAVRRLNQYEEQLSKDPNSSYYKQMIRDMRNEINSCDDQLQFLRSH